MSDRGDYRSFYVSMLDDPDFRDMPGDLFKLLFALRLTLGAAGIGVLRKLVLCEQLNISAEQLEAGLQALEAPKPESDIGWIVRDRRREIVWVVNALRFEPSLFAKNKKQKKFINNQVKPLSQNSPAVRAFWAIYSDWRTDEDPPTDTLSEGQREGKSPPSGTDNSPKTPIPIGYTNERVPEGYREANERESFHKRQATSDSDKQQATITSDKRPESGTAPPRDRFLARFYATATAERRAEIERQLTQLLRPEGLRVSRNRVARAQSQEHLNRAISDVLRGAPPRNPDRAIVVLFCKLDDAPKDANGESPTEAAQHREAELDRMTTRYNAAARQGVAAWASSNRAEYERIIERVEQQYEGKTGPMFDQVKQAERTQRCAKAAGFPDFDTWLEAQKVTA